jgi:hypothetical protein
VPEIDQNWTFGVYSSLYTKGGAQERFILHCAFLNQSLRLELYFKIGIVLEVLHTFGGWSICRKWEGRANFGLTDPLVCDCSNGGYYFQMSFSPHMRMLARDGHFDFDYAVWRVQARFIAGLLLNSFVQKLCARNFNIEIN